MSSYKGPRYWFRYLEILNFLKKYDLKGKKVLEIGAGTLHLSEYLASKGASVTALDMSEELKQSHKGLPVTLRDSITCIEADFLKHDFKSKNFDVIIAMEVLEHVEEEKLFLEKVKKLLKDKGIIIISVPAHMSMWSKHDEAVGHLRRYDSEDFKRVAGVLGVKNYQLLSYGWPWININRYLRIITTPFVYTKAKKMDQVERSVFSGKSIKKMNPLRFLSNKYVVYPFWLISRLFVKIGWSEGYIFVVRWDEKGLEIS
jgi:ubiquinone/menaquinone biosynthesis C-methylase UbiE